MAKPGTPWAKAPELFDTSLVDLFLHRVVSPKAQGPRRLSSTLERPTRRPDLIGGLVSFFASTPTDDELAAAVARAAAMP